MAFEQLNENIFETTLNNLLDNPHVYSEVDKLDISDEEAERQAHLLGNFLNTDNWNTLYRHTSVPKLILVIIIVLITIFSSNTEAIGQSNIKKAIEQYRKDKNVTALQSVLGINLNQYDLDNLEKFGTFVEGMDDDIIDNYVSTRQRCEIAKKETGLVGVMKYRDNDTIEIITTGITYCGVIPTNPYAARFGVPAFNIPVRLAFAAQAATNTIPNGDNISTKAFRVNIEDKIGKPYGQIDIPVINTKGEHLDRQSSANIPSEEDIVAFLDKVNEELGEEANVCIVVKHGIQEIEVTTKNAEGKEEKFLFCVAAGNAKASLNGPYFDLLNTIPKSAYELVQENEPNSVSVYGKNLDTKEVGYHEIIDERKDVVVFVSYPIDNSKQLEKIAKILGLLGGFLIAGLVGGRIMILNRNRIIRQREASREAGPRASNIADALMVLTMDDEDEIAKYFGDKDWTHIGAFMTLVDKLKSYNDDLKTPYLGELLKKELEARGFENPDVMLDRFSQFIDKKYGRDASGSPFRVMAEVFFTQVLYTRLNSEKFAESAGEFISRFPEYQNLLTNLIIQKNNDERPAAERKEEKLPFIFDIDGHPFNAKNVEDFIKQLIASNFPGTKKVENTLSEQLAPVLKIALENGDMERIKNAISTKRIELVEKASSHNHIIISCHIKIEGIDRIIYLELNRRNDPKVIHVYINNAKNFAETLPKDIEQ